MPDYRPDATTNKLLLLFIFDKMEIPLTENSIMDICTNKNNWLKYMDCKEYLAQLVESNLLYCVEPHKNTQLYSLTYEGRTCLSMFFQNIPISIRDDIVNFAKNNIQHIKRTQEYTSDYQKMSDGSYLNTFSIKDPHLQQSIFEIKMKFDNRSDAIAACKKWIDKAPEIYENMFISLINDN